MAGNFKQKDTKSTKVLCVLGDLLFTMVADGAPLAALVFLGYLISTTCAAPVCV